MIGSSLNELTEFTLDSYLELLHYLKKTCHVVRFCDAPRYDNYLILRHDIDFSPKEALNMAKLEREMGVKATYFALFSNSFYDLTDETVQDVIKEISGLGHEIGLHYFPIQYRSYNRAASDTLKVEIDLLEKISGQKVHTISRHGPWDRDPFFSVRGLINANHPYWRGDLFVHDSCRAWYPVEGLVELLKFPPRRVQLLTHPENWQVEKMDRTRLIDHLFGSSHASQLEKQALRKIWLTDTLVKEFDSKIGENSLKDIFLGYGPCREGDGSIARELKYYKNLVNYYFINSRTGWYCRKIISQIRGNRA